MDVALSIAGSDSGGGAGIQADMRTFHRLGTYATTVLTAVTAQNLQGVRDVSPVPPESIQAQIRAVCDGFRVRAVKTGMLWSASVIELVTRELDGRALPLVVDPVMVATAGGRLLQPDAARAYGGLFRLATVLTPNLDEATALLGRPQKISTVEQQCEAARALARRWRVPVLLKGGHLEGDPSDVLVWPDAEEALGWRHPRVRVSSSHGTGCALSAALAAHLAQGLTLSDAVQRAIAFVHDALRQAGQGLPAFELAEARTSALEAFKIGL